MKLHQAFVLCIGIICLSLNSSKGQDNVSPKPIQRIQLFPDSIRIEFQDQNAILLFQFKRLKEDLGKLEEFPNQLRTIDNLVKESLLDLTVPKKVLVIEGQDDKWEIEILDNPVVTKLRVKDEAIEELLPPGWDVHIESNYAVVHLYIHQWADVASLLNEDFGQITQSIKSKMDQAFIGRKRTISRTILNDKKLVFSDTKFQMPIDMLALNASFGFGYFRNSYYPEITLDAMIIRNDHFNRPYTQFGVIYENKFFTTSTENGFKSNTNSFLSLGFSINAYKLDDPYWVGLGGGLLVRNKGDYFQGKTAKFFITTGSKKIRIIPEFYLTNDFKTFSFGGKLSYTF